MTSAINRNRLMLTGLLVISIAGGWAVFRILSVDADGDRPITELTENVFYAGEGQRFAFYQQDAPEESGWALLPPEKQEMEFRSDKDPATLGFVKPETCAECHADIYETFSETAHHRTGGLATVDTVLGSFAAGENRLETRNPDVWFDLVEQVDGLYQRGVIRKDGQLYTHERRFDIVTGSGNHGQTYLYWEGDRLFQLPVSYFTESDGWINSPGVYRDGTLDFARGIGDRCLECHITYIAQDQQAFNRYDRTSLIGGVTCVRCHGPGWAHTQFHRTHEDASEARFILNPATLPRDEVNEICAQCHSGAGITHRPAFTHWAGERLADYVELNFADTDPHNADPHAANQLARLVQSRCFKESETLSCATCHNPHEQERGDLVRFVQRCMSCHDVDNCEMHETLGAAIDTRCIQCHMPSQRDAIGGMQTKEGMALPSLRDHLIKGWPDATQQVLAELQAEAGQSNREKASD